MKHKKIFFSIIVITITIFLYAPKTSAINTGFMIESFPSEDKEHFFSSIDLLLLKEEPAKRPIVCFDVNENNLIAIGQNESIRKIICVYSPDGIFLYGYSFRTMGTFEIEWDKENLNIHFVRGSTIISISPEGEILEIFSTLDNKENFLYSKEYCYANEKLIGDTKYCITNNVKVLDWIGTSYFQVISKDSSGSENIIYSAENHPGFILLTGFICFLIVIILIILRAISQKKTDIIKHIRKKH